MKANLWAPSITSTVGFSTVKSYVIWIKYHWSKLRSRVKIGAITWLSVGWATCNRRPKDSSSNSSTEIEKPNSLSSLLGWFEISTLVPSPTSPWKFGDDSDAVSILLEKYASSSLNSRENWTLSEWFKPWLKAIGNSTESYPERYSASTPLTDVKIGLPLGTASFKPFDSSDHELVNG